MPNVRILACTVAALVSGAVLAVPSPAAAAPAKIPDYNGDGFPDLAVGGPDTKVRGVLRAGAIGIMYGKSTGLDRTKVKAINQAMSVVPDNVEAEDRFGETLRSGDFDGDGFADLAVGVPGEKRAGARSGIVSILFGGKAAFTRGISVAPRATEGQFEHFGDALAAGDFNRDGYTDLYAMDTGWNLPGFVLYGKAGLHKPGQAKLVKLDESLLAADSKGQPDAGDVTGDGYADLVVVRGPDVVLYKGGPTGLATTPSQRVPGGGDVTAVGDIDRDGYADVVTGHAWTAVASKASAGHVRVRYGSAAGIDVARGSVVLHQNTSRIPDEAEPQDHFGQDVALGDINKDGFADLAIGVAGETIGAALTTGQVTVVYGSKGGIVPATAKIQSFSQISPGVGDKLEWYDMFGWRVDLRDYNRDGRADLVVSARDDNEAEGLVHVLKGTSTGLTGSGSLKFGPADLAMGHSTSHLGTGMDG